MSGKLAQHCLRIQPSPSAILTAFYLDPLWGIVCPVYQSTEKGSPWALGMGRRHESALCTLRNGAEGVLLACRLRTGQLASLEQRTATGRLAEATGPRVATGLPASKQSRAALEQTDLGQWR